jgi:two-component system sensor histidine kinase RpfC
MDVNMPEMSGIEAVKLLRFTHAPDELPPIVALSADATPRTREACRAAGFSAYLTKPVDTDLLLRTLGELTGQADPLPPPRSAEPTRGKGDGPGQEPDASLPALDQAKLASLAALDQGDGFLAGLIDDFTIDVQDILDQLEGAVARGDPQAFRDQAHALRSSAAHIGAVALFELCLGWRELDDHALALRARAELAQLRREITRTTLALSVFKMDRRLDASR